MTNENSIHVYNKGVKGKYGCTITDCHHKEIVSFYKSDLSVNDKPTPLIISDIIAIGSSLEYVSEHRGEKGIPLMPVVFVHTTYENNYNICSGRKTPDKCYQYVHAINQTAAQLSRFYEDRDHVKFCFSPKGTNLCMDSLESRLNHIPKN